MKTIFALILLFPVAAFAANKTAYTKAGCANNGDGTSASCAASPGAAGAWNTCAAMITGEVAANADLTAGGMNGILTINFSNTGGSTDTTRCVVNGFTTDSTHYLKFVGNWPGGTYSTSYYVLTGTAGSDDQGFLDVQDNDLWLDHFQVYDTSTGSGRRRAINASAAGALRLTITNSLIRNENCNIGGGGECWGLHFNPSAANAKIVVQNTASYADGAFTGCFNVDAGGGGNNGATVILQNNTAFNCNTGYQCNASGTSDTIDMQNNIGQNNATAAYNSACETGSYTTATRNTNLAEDTTAPGTTFDSKTVTFVSETGGSEDLRLQSGDTEAKDKGTDLSANGNWTAWVGSAVDAEGTTRSGTWDLGWDELPATTASIHSVLKQQGYY